MREKWLTYAQMRKESKPGSMRYRRYTNLNFGPLFNAETGAHHVVAANYEEADKLLPETIGAAESTQVLTAGEWVWVRQVPAMLGGFSDHPRSKY